MQEALQLSRIELQMMKEMFVVLSKYSGRTRRFGVNLVHSHFDTEPDEILYEKHDKEKRLLTLIPVKKKQFKTLPLATAWQIDNEGHIAISQFCCDGAHDRDISDGPVKD